VNHFSHAFRKFSRIAGEATPGKKVSKLGIRSRADGVMQEESMNRFNRINQSKGLNWRAAMAGMGRTAISSSQIPL